MSQRILQILLCIILGSNLSVGQENYTEGQPKKWIGLEVGYVSHNLQDKGHSPLKYNGKSIFTGLSFHKQNEKIESSFKVSFLKGQMKPLLPNQASYNLNFADRTSILGSYSLLKRTRIRDSLLTISFGGLLSVFFDFDTYNHNANNPVSYELSIAIGPALKVTYELSDKINLLYSGSIPLLAYSVRPNALGFFPLNDLDVGLWTILTGGSVASVTKTFYLQSRAGIELNTKKVDFILFYDYFGGLNIISERKGFSFHKIGVQFPFNIRKK